MTKATKIQTGQNHLEYLDGLRAVAALWVMLYHAYLILLGSPDIPWYLGFLDWIRHGHFAVGLFIVISGFCLTLPITKKKTMYPQPKIFYLRRAIRILPPLYITLIVAILFQFTYQIFSKNPPQTDILAIIYSIFLIQDIFPNRSYPAQWLWTVNLEFRLYLFFPLIIHLLLTRGPYILVLVGFIIGGILTKFCAFYASYDSWELCSPWYFFLFTLGIYSCWVSHKPEINSFEEKSHLLCIFTIMSLIILCQMIPISSKMGKILLPVSDSLLGIATASGMIAISRNKSNVFRRFLKSKLLTNLGKISFSLYLVHLIFIFNFQTLYRNQHIIDNKYIAFCISVSGCLLLALIFFKTVEEPFISLLSKLKSRTVQE
ncbi:acyltransferase [Armatimonas sp.]|uniref:acyltransferase family protein n=1 Tax=Armatimonas sp. TaxID=1872638 RepID=UPI00286B84A7|nr:acyltransferase [Armatimonas sp.]